MAKSKRIKKRRTQAQIELRKEYEKNQFDMKQELKDMSKHIKLPVNWEAKRNSALISDLDRELETFDIAETTDEKMQALYKLMDNNGEDMSKVNIIGIDDDDLPSKIAMSHSNGIKPIVVAGGHNDEYIQQVARDLKESQKGNYTLIYDAENTVNKYASKTKK